MDINLPGMNGFESLARIRRTAAIKDIPVIALTADAMPAQVKKGLKAGFRAYLTKPIKIKEVMAAITDAPNDASESSA